ncbi:MAG: adenosylmethionine decarboxylase [Candidatus Nezhaarchaeales archaeon]
MGRHLIIEFYGCNPEMLANDERIKKTLLRSIEVMGGHVKGECLYKFPPYGGITLLIAIAESHVSIHTWPEHGYAAIDIFTCGSNMDPWKAYDVIINEFKPRKFNVTDIRRGILEEGTVDNSHTIK